MRLADSSTRCVVILHPGKYLGIITGISLASVLMIQQLGILVSIFTTNYSFISDIALLDIWVDGLEGPGCRRFQANA